MSVGIGDLLRELDIVDVISSYIDLKRSGNNYKANCPFHPDDTPSFFVSPQKGIWKCFGCGVGGDFIKFVALYENIPYTEAAKEIAKRYGIKLKIKESPAENSKIYEAMELVASFYFKNILRKEEALSYIKSRGIDSHTLKKFLIGYADNSKELVDNLKEEGLLEYYEKTGNLIKSDEFYRDLFKGRIVIPVRDERGRIVAFGGRSLGEEKPKYINSPESEIFKKSKVLFGFYESLNYIKELGRVIITEGYFDVISLFQYNIRYAVAPLGTSLTEYHAKLISRYAEEVILLFDGDEAGRKAVKRAVPNLLKEDLRVKVFYLPDGEDADTYIRKTDMHEFKKRIESLPDIFEELIESIKNGEKEALKEFINYVGYLKDSIKAYDMIVTVSKITGMSVTSLSERINSVKMNEEKEKIRLSMAECIFLKGLLELKQNDIDIYSLKLSPEAIMIAESILRKDYEEIPRYIINMKVSNLKESFEHALRELLKEDLDIEELPETFEERKRLLKMRAFAESNRFRLR